MVALDIDPVPRSVGRLSALPDLAPTLRRERWQRRLGIPAPGAWPVAAAFVVSLAVSAALTADGTAHPHLGLVVLTVGATSCAWGASAAQVFAIAGVTWLFDNGFMSGHLGDLQWRGPADVRALALLLAGAGLAAAVGRQDCVKKRHGAAKPSSRAAG
jgi:hypothetical protein